MHYFSGVVDVVCVNFCQSLLVALFYDNAIIIETPHSPEFSLHRGTTSFI